MLKKIVAVVVFALCAAAYAADPIYVKTTDDLAALVAAVEADDTEFVLEDGVHQLTAPISFSYDKAKKIYNITIRSESGDPDKCFVDGGKAMACITAFGGYNASHMSELRGITFRNGLVSSSSAAVSGGGVTCTGFTNIRDCNFTDNRVETSVGNYAANGGALYINGSTVTISNCVFCDNVAWADASTATASGGAVYFANSKSGLQFYDCKFVDNLASGGKAASGGALYGNSQSQVFFGCLFAENVATNHLSVSGGNGGGVFGRGFVYTDCVFSNNVATSDGGGYKSTNGNATGMTNCLFTGNVALQGSGGALYVTEKTAFYHCSIVSNTCAASGGGVGYTGAGSTFAGCLVEGNSSKVSGGGLNLPHGGAFTDCVIRGNRAGDGVGGGIYSGLNRSNQSPLFMTNCVVEGNGVVSTQSYKNHSGGGVYADFAPCVEIEGCVFSKNSYSGSPAAGYGAGALHIVQTTYQTYVRTNAVVRNCLFADNSGVRAVSFHNEQTVAPATYENAYGVKFSSCSFIGNEVSSEIFHNTGDSETTGNAFFRNCLMLGNAGDGGKKIFWGTAKTGEMDAGLDGHVQYCLADTDAVFFPADGTDHCIRSDKSKAGGGKGTNEPWMTGATDIGDGTYSITKVGDYGIAVAMNNAKKRILGGTVCIGAQEILAPGLMLLLR